MTTNDESRHLPALRSHLRPHDHDARHAPSTSIRGDRDDVFSRGFICPKAYALKELDADPDRLRTPLIRRDGRFVAATWDEAMAEIDRGLGAAPPRARPRRGRRLPRQPQRPSSLGPLHAGADQRARHPQRLLRQHRRSDAEAGVGGPDVRRRCLSIPVPDLDRTDYLLMLGANPLASNGSLMTAPDMKGRLRSLRARGGRLVVDRPAPQPDRARGRRPSFHPPRHRRLSPVRDRAHALRRAPRRARSAGRAHGRARRGRARWRGPSAPEAVAPITGLAAPTSSAESRASCAAPSSAAVYGRIGTCTQEFGTLASWLVDVLNVLTGNLDREGGAMFPKAAAGSRNATGMPGIGRGVRFGRFASRVRGLPEVYGELPAACLAEEIDTPGDGRIRALVTVAGNPVLEHAERRTPPRRARQARLHGERRHLPERDHPPRQRHPAGALGAAALALRRRPLQPRGAQRRQLLAAALPARPRASSTSGRCC